VTVVATELGVRESAAAIAAGALSPVELTRAYLARIEADGGRLNAFRTVMAEQALADAEAAEAAVERDAPLGPLHGVPIAVKDNIAVRDVAMTAATRLLDGYVADADAEVITRLRDAGAILLGKLHMSEWAIGGTGQNVHFGAGRNAWDRERISGGSSAGSGVAVAADLAPATLGSDTGGSVRIPAALNGVTGLRPTAGRISNRGTVPVAWTFDTIGPMARRVEDIARLLEVLAGPDPGDPACADLPAGGYEAALEHGAQGLRIGLLTGDFRDELPSEVAALLDAAAAVFEDLGAQVEPVPLRGLTEAAECIADLLLAEAYAQHAQRLAIHPDGFAPDVVARLRRGAGVSGADYGHGRQHQRRWTRAVLGALEGRHLLLAPATAITAPLIAESEPLAMTGRLARYVSSFGLARVPVLALPCGFAADGLPIGLQLVGRHFDEAVLLRAAHAYQGRTDWHLRRPAA
jgi:aspartyl-tRNA(Asn)/glutamyl-tRNA(Gln) amidotransferase subunit A